MRILTGILAATLVAGVSTVAMAQTNSDGWYVGAEGGANFVPKEKFKNGNSADTWKQSNDVGYGLLGQGGYAYGPYRFEGELGWRSNGVDKVTGAGLSGGKGDLDVLSLMGNVYYDIKTGTPFTPYVGVGIGGADLRANKIRANVGTLSDDDSITFAYQGILGTSYALNDALSLNADYRYFRTTETDLKLDSNIGGGKDKTTYQSHGIFVGFTYKFGAPAAKPAPIMAAAPAPAPAPMPAPAPKSVAQQAIAKSYLVFFDFDKSDVTPEARKIITQAADNAKVSKATSIQLTGHTDAAGSEKYNVALSLRRANSVKAELVKQGIPADEISVVGKGKADQLVATKDGVREPQNRRVQILLP